MSSANVIRVGGYTNGAINYSKTGGGLGLFSVLLIISMEIIRDVLCSSGVLTLSSPSINKLYSYDIGTFCYIGDYIYSFIMLYLFQLNAGLDLLSSAMRLHLSVRQGSDLTSPFTVFHNPFQDYIGLLALFISSSPFGSD